MGNAVGKYRRKKEEANQWEKFIEETFEEQANLINGLREATDKQAQVNTALQNKTKTLTEQLNQAEEQLSQAKGDVESKARRITVLEKQLGCMESRVSLMNHAQRQTLQAMHIMTSRLDSEAEQRQHLSDIVMSFKDFCDHVITKLESVSSDVCGLDREVSGLEGKMQFSLTDEDRMLVKSILGEVVHTQKQEEDLIVVAERIAEEAILNKKINDKVALFD
ncbi:uncharacterized protein LOC116615381 [Nematostella vectensis]|uniref:uncharacterized protein LOC116615381 n=1 Tax=Nematostella vectensis TaxID=45351 RepID=UPI002076DF63|nr:uncharacterized protein LOC116615381 [Nematostella vectensis]